MAVETGQGVTPMTSFGNKAGTACYGLATGNWGRGKKSNNTSIFLAVYLYLFIDACLNLISTNRNIYLPVSTHNTYMCIYTCKYRFTYIFIFNPHKFNPHKYIYYLH